MFFFTLDALFNIVKISNQKKGKLQKTVQLILTSILDYPQATTLHHYVLSLNRKTTIFYRSKIRIRDTIIQCIYSCHYCIMCCHINYMKLCFFIKFHYIKCMTNFDLKKPNIINKYFLSNLPRHSLKYNTIPLFFKS